MTDGRKITQTNGQKWHVQSINFQHELWQRRKRPECLRNLYLSISASGARSWRLIYRFAGKRREMGLGSVPTVTLGMAREKASAARVQISDGVDPLVERAGRKPVSSMPTFGEVTLDLISSLEGGWKNPKHRQQWRNTLTTYAAPIWDQPVDAVTTEDILAILRPIWSVVPETANRLRGRMERVLDAAKVRGYRTGGNPALWKGHLSIMLPPRVKMASRNHHAAMPFEKVGAFMSAVQSQHGVIAARALEFTILTAARTSEALNATWSEIDVGSGVWTVPAVRMKGGVIHRVPLAPAVMTLLDSISPPNRDPGAYIFPGAKPGRPMSNMSMEMLLRRMNAVDCTVHGFRSSFRDWAGERTDYPREVAEAALAHSVGNAVERAYRRQDALDKRRSMMEDWAVYVGNG
jgi:integrase